MLGYSLERLLGKRKQGANSDPPGWLDDLLIDAYEPTSRDFRK